MTYIARFDPNGRGKTEEESLFGFDYDTLSWGNRKADIMPDIRANPFVSSQVEISVP